VSVTDTPARIRELLAPLAPQALELIDDSHRHAGHAGAASGGGHYRLQIVSAQFAGLNAVQRHRAVFGHLQSLMQSRIHALSITALTPEEAASKTAGLEFPSASDNRNPS
jgi:BolA family transcriptional regulator, general stress-responsive regulator